MNTIDFSPMKLKQDTPKVGVAVFLEFEAKILFILRAGSHRSGTWSLPGGHIDLGETLQTTCKREVKEEIGVDIYDIKHFDFANAVFENEGLHYVTLYFTAKIEDGQEPKIMEPEKIKELKWFYPDNPPHPLFSDNLTKMVSQYWKKQDQDKYRLLREVYLERG